MFTKIKNWFSDRLSGGKNATPRALRESGYFEGRRSPVAKEEVPDLTPEFDDVEPGLDGEIESLGPGKNVLIRNRFVRQDTGTHETFKILDDSIVDSGEETGLDPYNTGKFDRSKKWDQRSRD